MTNSEIPDGPSPTDAWPIAWEPNQIPEAAIKAAATALAKGGWSASLFEDYARLALAAALPHLRVQETPRWVTIEDADDDSDEPWPSGLSPDNPFLTPQAEYIHVHSNGPDAADCTTCEPPHPRPVIDREALEDVLTRHWFVYIGEEEGFDCGCNEHGTLPAMPTVTEAASHLADMVLALLPTEEAPWEGIKSREPEGEAAEQLHRWYAAQDDAGEGAGHGQAGA
jgi:hypothetical protein